MRRVVVGSLAVGAGATLGCLGLVTGRLTLDLGVGRRTRPLGPIVADIAAPREIVFAAATAPYAERRPRAMREKVEILELSELMVLAAHHTAVGRLTATTVETVAFDPPSRITFRLVRGPVPHVVETFELDEIETGTRLTYTGTLGTDLWTLGSSWGDVVARSWVRAVEQSLAAITEESERRARHERQRPGPTG